MNTVTQYCFVVCSLIFSIMFGALGLVHAMEVPLQKIAFGSCMKQTKPKPILNRIVEQRPDLMLFIGDNIYGNSENAAVLEKKYLKLSLDPDYQNLKRHIPIQATWDDHDFGVNDGGSEYPNKAESKKVMLDFFGEPQNSERRSRPGVFTSSLLGPLGKQVQVILLDTRWFRSRLKIVKGPFGREKYFPNYDLSATLLGEEQWVWLEQQLAIPAQVRIIASSIQVIAQSSDENWANFPHEKVRLLRLLQKTSGKKVLISGDIHHSELSCQTLGGEKICDLTSSGITQTHAPWPGKLLPRHRPGVMHKYWRQNNFGLIEIDWNQTQPAVQLKVISLSGKTAFKHKL